MVDKELEEIKKLPPKERVQKIKELEQKRKKEEEEQKKKEVARKQEANEMKKLLETSMEEIKTQEVLEQIEVPSGEIYLEDKFKQDEDELEGKVNEDERAKAIQLANELETQYNINLDSLTSYETYDNLQRWVAESADGSLKPEYDGVVRNMYGEINRVQQLVRASNNYQTSTEVLEKLDTAKEMLKKIGYHRNIFD